MKHTLTFNLDIEAAKAELGEPMDEVGYMTTITDSLRYWTPGVSGVTEQPQSVWILERHDDSYRSGGESHVHGVFWSQGAGLDAMYKSITLDGEFEFSGQDAVAEVVDEQIIRWSYLDDDGFETVLSRYTIDN